MPIEPSKPAPLAWFTRTTAKYAPHLAELMVISIAMRLIGLVQPFVFQALIDRVLPFQRMESLNLILVVLAGATVFSALFGAVSAYLGTHMANGLISELGRRIYEHLLRLPLRYLQRWRVGEMLARVSEIDTVRTFLTGTLSGIVLDALFALIYLAVLLSISPLLTLIVVVMLPLRMAAFAVIGPFLRARMRERFQASSLHKARLVETFTNLVTLKSLAAEEIHHERVSATLDANLGAGFRVAKLEIVNNVVGEVLQSTSVILVIYFGALLTIAGDITLGQLIAFHLIAEGVTGPVVGLSQVWERWQALGISRQRLGDVINAATENEPARPHLAPRARPTLAAEDLCFSYIEEQPVLRNVSLEFHGGRTNLVVGDSGCGKSTLAKVLTGLYAPSRGRVLFAGADIARFDPASVRRRIAYVPQEPALFSGTIRENLLAADPGATDEELHSALAESACMHVVEQLHEGMDSQVGESGGFLSGGQRQRVALARALLCNPDVLVLDEPTSALDETSATVVMETLARLSREKTVIIITHRPDMMKAPSVTVDLSRAGSLRVLADA